MNKNEQYIETVKKYSKAIDQCPEFEMKGKNMLYTSANGHMFSAINKAGELGIRFSDDKQKEYIKALETDFFYSYGAKMRGYVLIPETILADDKKLIKMLQESYKYVMSLDSK